MGFNSGFKGLMGLLYLYLYRILFPLYKIGKHLISAFSQVWLPVSFFFLLREPRQ